jgi:uncharacterized protein YceK
MKLFWRDVLIFLALVVGLIVLVSVLGGCGGVPRVDTAPAGETIGLMADTLNDARAHTAAGAKHIEAAGTAAEGASTNVKKARAATSQPSVAGFLDAATNFLNGLSTEISGAATETAATSAALTKLQKENDELRRQLGQIKIDTDNLRADDLAMHAKWDDAWFGGKFWRYVRWITIGGSVLVIGLLLLNAYTGALTFFAAPLMALWHGVLLPLWVRAWALVRAGCQSIMTHWAVADGKTPANPGAGRSW